MKLDQGIKLAMDLLAKHKKKSWTFILDADVYNETYCDYKRNAIGMSRFFITSNDKKVVENGILHAIAHAMTPGAGHTEVWVDACLKIGADPSIYRKTTKDYKDIIY